MTTDNKQAVEQQLANENANEQENLKELVNALHWNGLQALKSRFEGNEVDGQVMTHELYGPIFLFQVKGDNGHVYTCGFFMRELISAFQQKQDPTLWMSSFFVDLMKVDADVLLPRPPQSEDEAKALVDKTIVPHCAHAVRAEFDPEPVHIDLELHEEHGPVLEAGFPSIKDGSNVCAMPLHFLMAHFLLNRDPADLLIQGLYRIKEEHGLA